MNKFNITKTFLYNWRYTIGYSVIAIGLIAILIFAGINIPGGISNQEIKSVIISDSTNFSDFWSIDVINLPYHLLQHASMAFFGVSIFSIKLPSIILAFMSVLGLLLLLRQWFKPNIAILVSLITITTGQFLFISQNGTPEILYIFWPIWIILLASILPVQKKFRKLIVISLFAASAISLYTPLSLYMLLAIVAAVILHPHLRYLIKKLSKSEILIGAMIVSITLAPLVNALVKLPKLGLTLLGIPDRWPNFISNISSLGNQYFGFMNSSNGIIITPFFGLGLMLIIALGIYYVVKSRETAKSYVLMIWTLFLFPLVLINPDFTGITFLPLIVLFAFGLNGLLSHWYELFPRNPYARIGGLIPIIILVIVLVSLGTSRYIYSYKYDPNIVSNFSNDIELIPSNTKNIVVVNNELTFYRVISKFNSKITVSVSPNGNEFLATHESKNTFSGYKIDRIITNSLDKNSDRFYLYKKSSD
ncbi:MAG: glycosyltransferase family 39 protein [Candidatus Saccharibacteria bacterium]